MTRAFIAAFLLAVLSAGAFLPQALAESPAAKESTLVPHPAKGRGEKCVADTSYMRRFHMLMLKHERDETVHDGVRGGKFSIKECVSCHAVNGADGKPVSYESPQHFCRTCHDYAAVSLDCFECHASRPGEKSKSSAVLPDSGSTTALASYEQGNHR
jgi:predicted CXXCH cytochrome family protein